MRKLFLSVLSGILLLAGCMTKEEIKQGYIVTQKERYFGLKVLPTGSSTTYPQVVLGWGSVVTSYIPTSKGTNIYAPNYIDTLNLMTGLNPLDANISENFGAGESVANTNAFSIFKLNSSTNSVK